MKDLAHSIKYHLVFFRTTLLLLFLYGCSGSDYTEELSGNYFYRDEGPDTKDILCHSPNKKGIYSKILAYDYNSDFIVAAQQPIYDEYKMAIAFNLRDDLKKYPTNSKEEGDKSEKEADSILKHDPYYKLIFAHKINYWIIVNKTEEVLGPITKGAYNNRRKELGIPESIQIKQ